MSVALLIVCGAFALHDNLLGRTLTNAFLPDRKAVAPEDTSATEVPSAPVETPQDPLPDAPADQLYTGERVSFKGLKPLPPTQLRTVDTETLWLARCIFSETKRKEEQELIAWIVRNRVETRYRGRRTYKDVVLDPMQFSAFNPGTRTRRYYMSLTPQSRVPGWQTALRIAHEVRQADPYQWRPFPVRTRHFYSEQSMVGRRHPNWASGMKPVVPERPYRIEARRFRFFEGIS